MTYSREHETSEEEPQGADMRLVESLESLDRELVAVRRVVVVMVALQAVLAVELVVRILQG